MKTSGCLASTGKILFFTFLVFALLSNIVMATIINSAFSCNNYNAETTFYSYLKEPELQESGYTHGLKTGTFNYFKGGHVYLEDTLTHYDGKVVNKDDPDEDHNASVSHQLIVDFRGDKDAGDKSVSEFYAKGFYNNNRVLSAGKKIWFLDEKYPSNDVRVDATADMTLAGVYNFDYSVDARNAYFVFYDSSGWSNKTGSRRIDWEQSGLMKGEHINVTNDLSAAGMRKALAGDYEDWLPCCAPSGTIPKIEPIWGTGSEWPSSGVYAMLLPKDKKLENCAIKGDCGSGENACILTTGEQASEATGVGGKSISIPQIPPLLVESFAKPKGEGYEFTINVRNMAKYGVNNVNLWLTVPTGMEPQTDTATVNGEIQPVDRVGSNLIWELGDLRPTTGLDGVKTIKIQIDKGDSTKGAKDIPAYATYRIGGGPIEKTDPPAVPVVQRPHSTGGD